MPTKSENEVMAALIRDLVQQFDGGVVELQDTSDGVTALLRVRPFGLAPGPGSVAAPDGQQSMVPVEDVD